MRPTRIVSLLSSGTEILFALGAGDRVLGISHECDFPPAAQHLPRLTQSLIATHADSQAIDQQVRGATAEGGGLFAVDADTIRELAPQLIVTQSQCDVCAVNYDTVCRIVAQAPNLSETIIVDLNPMRLDDLFVDIERVGFAIGEREAATALNAHLRDRLRRIEKETTSMPFTQRPRVVCIEWVDPLMIAANWVPDLVDVAGGQNGLCQAGKQSEFVRWSEIRDYNPEVLFIMPCGFDLARSITEVELLRHQAGYEQLAAVRLGRVYALDANHYFTRSGPRLIDSVEVMAHLLHPALFPAPPLTAWRAIT